MYSYMLTGQLNHYNNSIYSREKNNPLRINVEKDLLELHNENYKISLRQI